MRKLLFLFSFCISLGAAGQERHFSINRDMNTRIAAFIEHDTTGFHSAIKPYSVLELKHIMHLRFNFGSSDGRWEVLFNLGREKII